MSKKVDKDYDIEDDRKRVLRKTLFLRATRLDEIPQLINVLKGDLSFIGPRPLLVEYNKIYTEHQARRLDIKPGITGWSQINLSKINSWSEKFNLDIWYLNNISLALDTKIIFYTFIFLIKSFFNKNKNKNYIFSEKFNGKN